MILGGLIKLVMAILIGLVALLPTYTPPPAADLTAFQVVAWLVPINEILTLVSVMSLFAAGSLAFFAANWLANKFRGSG